MLESSCSASLESPSSSLLRRGSLSHKPPTAYVPATNEEERTALQAAAEEGNIELVQLLLAAGADANAGVRWGCRAISVSRSLSHEPRSRQVKLFGGMIDDG